MELRKVIAALEKFYGKPKPPKVTDPFEMILYENVAYLVDDVKRDRVWAVLKKEVGADPEAILDYDEDELAAVIKDGGMQPPMRAGKLRRAARLAMDSFDGDLGALFKQPLAKIRRGLKRFPGIGDPGADKILMFSRTHPVLALESNGLRALLRLGFAEDTGNYAATYRLVQEAIEPEIKQDYDWLIAAHQLLRRHGQTVCKRSRPLCAKCPMAKQCPAAKVFLIEAT
jgi:endonuclease III